MNEQLQRHIRDIQTMLAGDQGSALWDILTCLRGPDSPSERPDMTGEQAREAYMGRRKRKRTTVEVVRGVTFPGCGSARWRNDVDYVSLPPTKEWDHFDKHVARAAHTLGLQVKIKGED